MRGWIVAGATLALGACAENGSKQQRANEEGVRAATMVQRAEQANARSGQSGGAYLRFAKQEMAQANQLAEKGDDRQAWNKYSRARADAMVAAAMAERDEAVKSLNEGSAP